MKVLIDYLPTEVAEAAALQRALLDNRIKSKLSLEEVGDFSNVESHVMRLAEESDCFVLVWSPTATQLFEAEKIVVAKELARRFFGIGPDKFVIWRTGGAIVPFTLSDLPSYDSIEEILLYVRHLLFGERVISGDFIRPTGPKDFFLSHSSKDMACADRLRRMLEEKVSVWYAPRDLRQLGMYGKAILVAVRSCERMLLLLTPNSISSPHCIREVYLALENRKQIVVLSELPHDKITDDWAYPLAGVHLAAFDCANAEPNVLQHVLN